MGRRLLNGIGLAAWAALGLATSAFAQTTPLTTTTNQNSQVNAAATWTHPYWGVETLCSDPACNPVIPILNPNQQSPLNSIYDYYAYSPPVSKFVDPLPTVPIAVPDQSTYPGSDYYELSVEDYKYPFHRDMGRAVLRGYVQTNDASGSLYAYTDSQGTAHSWPLAALHQNDAGYAGPQIINVRNTPTRVKMTNNKSITGSAPHAYPDGSNGPSGLQIPVDETMPGAGSGPPVHLSAKNEIDHTTASPSGGVNAFTAAGSAIYHATAGTYTYHPSAGSYVYHTASNTIYYHQTPGAYTIHNPARFQPQSGTISYHPTAGSTSFFINSGSVNYHTTAGSYRYFINSGSVNYHASAGSYRYFINSGSVNYHQTAGSTSGFYTSGGAPCAAGSAGCATRTFTWAANQQCNAAQAGAAGNPFACTPYTWTLNASCAGAPAITGGGAPICTTATWAAGAQCTAAQAALPGNPYQCTPYTWTANTSCVGAPTITGFGAPACTTTTWTAGSQCTSTQAGVAGNPFACTPYTWTANASCVGAPTITGFGAPACATVNWNASSTCSAAQAANSNFQCVTDAWTAGSACTLAEYAIPGNPGRCTVPVTWAANAVCTSAQAAIPGYQCTTDTYTANSACTAAEQAIAGNAAQCATDSWTQYAQCTSTDLGIPGVAAACTTDTWAVNAACSSVEQAVPGIVSQCTTATWAAGQVCSAAQLGNPNFPCTNLTWAKGAKCASYMSPSSPAVAPFYCQTYAWNTGDYCSVTQADDPLYSCQAGDYSFDRALLHQHGGNTPWISDGTPHQWTTPVGDTTSPYKRGVSNFNIPDMPCAFDTATNTNPANCDGVNTYYYTNQNSARMMWYHDHSYGLTRTNVYNGELSLYFVTDPIEQAMLGKGSTGNSAIDNVLSSVGLSSDQQTPATGAIPTYQPDNRFGDTLGTTLAIQDKTFVWGYDNNSNFTAAAAGDSLSSPYTTKTKDSLWSSACGKNPASTTEGNPLQTFAGGSLNIGPFGSKNPCPTDTGSLWFPHVYSSNTDPNTGATVSGGRWDFAPWTYPAGTIFSQYLPTVSAVPESFLDTIVTNGKAYPFMNVPRKPMRFRIINASNERYLNLQLYYAVNNSGVASGTTSTGSANPFAFNVDPSTVCNNGGNTDAAAPQGTTGLTTHNYTNCSEVGMILQNSSQKTGAYLVPIPAYIKPPAPCTQTNLVDCAANKDGTPYSGTGPVYIPVNTGTWAHFGGVPDPTTQVPFIQIGNEGGFLPFPIVHYNQTAEIETDPRNITLSNVRNNPVSNPPTCPGCVLPYPGYTLALGPAERADIIIDFGSIPDGATLILYNDMIAPNPGYDQRYDEFTGDADMTAINGPRTTQQGQGPNTRTIMQFRVDGTINFPGALASTDTNNRTTYSMPLPANWVEEINPYGNQYNSADARPIASGSSATLNAALAAAFAASHADPQVSASATTTTAPRTAPDGQRNYQDGTPYFMGAIDPPLYLDLTAAGVTSGKVAAACDGSDPNLKGCPTSRLCTYSTNNAQCAGGVTEFPTCAINSKNPLNGNIDNSKDPNYRKTCGFPVFTKAIAEDSDPASGRLNALLGNETTSLEANGQQTYGFPFVEPITERQHEGETQIWQVIHNGVDTHTVHFHLMNVQVIGRIDWAGIPKLPDAEERGWKELVKFQPLETTIIAVRMNRPGQNYDHPQNNPVIPFAVPTSMRVSDVTSAIGETDPAANAQDQQLLQPFMSFGVGQSLYANAVEDFSWEYVWHCHLLGHEEADMMRPQVMQLDNNGVAGQPAVPPPDGLTLGIQ